MILLLIRYGKFVKKWELASKFIPVINCRSCIVTEAEKGDTNYHLRHIYFLPLL